MPEAILQAKLDMLERKLRGIAHLVTPCDGGIVDDDAVLTQQPQAESLVVGARVRIDGQTRNAQPSRRLTPHEQARLLDGELLQAQIQEKERRPRDDQTGR